MLVVLGALGVVTLLVSAFGPSGARPVLPVAPTTGLITAGRPQPVLVATVGNLRVRLPVAQDAVSAIGFHASQTGGLALKPLGRQINEGLLARLWHKISGSSRRGPAWFQLGGGGPGPGTAVLDVGAAAGTDVYAPVDGTVVAITETVIDGSRVGSEVDVRPTAAPSVIVAVRHVQPDPALTVGSAVFAGSSRLGAVVDVAKVERQALAAHTNDAGDNVEIEAHAASTSLP